MTNEPKVTPPVTKLWTFGDADNYEITTDVPADTERPPVCITLPPQIASDPADAEIDLTWAQFVQLRDVVDQMYRWVRGEGLAGDD